MGYKKKKNDDNCDDPLKPTPFEIKVVAYIHKNLRNIDGKLSGCRVSIFYPQNAVDILLNSPWSKLNMKEKYPDLIHFTSEKAACDFMSQLLRKGLISRALKSKKIPNKRKDLEKKKRNSSKVTDCGIEDSKSERKQNTIVDQEKEARTEKKPLKESSKSESKCKMDSSSNFGFFSLSPPTKPIRIEFTADQIFLLTDTDTVYVWIYEPPPGLKAWLLGTALIIGIMFCCFFPIWPWQLRQGAYYLTVMALALMCLIFLLAILRIFLYLMVLIFTVGGFHFWLFPNLFSDCGVMDSFKPLYSIENVKSRDRLSDKKGSKSSSKSLRKSKNISAHENTSSNEDSLNKQPNIGTDDPLKSVKSDLGKQD